jgi:excisionase family DNA binding protein
VLCVATQQVLYSVPDITAKTRVGRTLVYREIAAGRLRSVKVGARRLVTAAALDEWVQLLEREAEE